MMGYYVEGGYNLLDKRDTDHELIAFVRYENYNTQHEVAQGTTANLAYNRTERTLGLMYKLAQGAAFKADYQLLGNEAMQEDKEQINLGVAIWF
jgi:hypothetical protein